MSGKRVAASARRQTKRRRPEQKSTAVDWNKGAEEEILSSDGGDDFFQSSTAADGKDTPPGGDGSTASGPSKGTGSERIEKAKQYLQQLMAENEAEENEKDADAAVSARLRDDAIHASGRLMRKVAHKFLATGASDTLSVRKYRGHHLAVTCVAVGCGDTAAFSGSKDCSIIRWDVETGKRVAHFKGRRTKVEGTGRAAYAAIAKVDHHTDQVLALAVSPDGRFLASGGRDRVLRVWDLRTNTHSEAFTGHLDALSSLAFKKTTDGSNVLASGSFDRTIKLWNIDQAAYMETLFGHQAQVMGLAAVREDNLFSCGRDGTARLWNLPKESQLIYRGRGGSHDCAAMINEKQFVTGADDGGLYLWSSRKKKAVCVVPGAHGDSDSISPQDCNWVSAVGTWGDSDLVASGSGDGHIRLWAADTESGSLDAVGSVPVKGFTNGIAFAASGRFMVAGIGQEHRLGRWWRQKGVRSGIAVVDLSGVLSSP